MFYTPLIENSYYPNYTSSASNAINTSTNGFINSNTLTNKYGAQICGLYKEQIARLHEEMPESKDIKLIRSHKNLTIISI